MLRVLALIPLLAPPKAPIGLLDDEPNEPKEAGAKEAGEKAPPRLGEPPAEAMAAIGDMADMADIGLEKDIPDMPDMPGKPPNPADPPKLSL